MSLVRSDEESTAGVARVQVDVVTDGIAARVTDSVSMEEPLQIRLVHGPAEARIETDVAVTMRTPGDDATLALGFLHTEGIIGSRAEVTSLEEAENEVTVELAPSAGFDPEALRRNTYATSSCGVCGKASIEAVHVHIPDRAGADRFSVDAVSLGSLPAALRARQEAFEQTGGIHAAASFGLDGGIERVAEDVGRHNALDKLIGGYLADDALPLSGLGIALQRPGQLRAGAEGGRGRLPVRGRYRSAVEPRGRTGCRAAHDARGLPAGWALQHLHPPPSRAHRRLRRATEDITAVVLCGGSGTRLGIGDKTLLPVLGRPLVSYTAETLRPQVGRLILGCGRDPQPYEALGYEVVADQRPGTGPLGGVISALAAVTSDWVLVHPGDTPLPDRGLVARLSPAADTRGIAVPRTGGQRQHLVVLMSRAMAGELAAYYEAGGRAVRRWLDGLGIEGVDMSDVAESFFNVNTPDDLSEAERRIAAAQREGSGG